MFEGVMSVPSDEPPQPTAKRKPGRPRGSGRKVVPPFAPPIRKKPGRPKGLKNKPKAEADLHHKAGKALRITQLAHSKARSSTPHPTFQGVWKTPPASRKIPPGQVYGMHRCVVVTRTSRIYALPSYQAQMIQLPPDRLVLSMHCCLTC